MRMTTSAVARLRAADGTAAILAAGYDAFEVVLSVLWQHQERAGHLFAAFVMSAAAAADGRDALAVSASLPAVGPQADCPAIWPHPDASIDEVADEIAALSGLLATRLSELGECVPGEEDRTAFAEATCAAERVHALLRGTRR